MATVYSQTNTELLLRRNNIFEQKQNVQPVNCSVETHV